MNRAAFMATAVLAGLVLSACGPAAANGPGAAPSPSGRGRGGFNRGAAGELVKIEATVLTLSSSQGDTTVVYSSSPPVIKTSTASFADIQAGECALIVGRKDATGAITATGVRLSDKVNGACALQGGFGGGGGGGFLFGGGGGPGGPGGQDRSGSPLPSPSVDPSVAFVRGEVTAISGTSVTVKDATAGTTQTASVPTTVPVTKSITITASQLAVGDCVRAVGARDSSGKVTASALTVQPAGPSGCFTGGGFGGGFGVFGGGRGGGGGGGGGFGPPPDGAPGG